MNNLNILITSVGRRSYIVNYFKKELEGLGKVHTCNSTYTLGMQAADSYFIAPAIYSDSYIDTILDYCAKNSISAVLSLFDIDLLVLAKNERRFKDADIELVLAPERFVSLCNDKYKTAQFAASLGLNTPKTYKSIDEVMEAISAEEVHFPVIIKPRWGMASLSIYTAHNELELRVFSEAAKREIHNSYLKFETSFTPANPLIYQEILEGKEYGLDVINDLQGNFQAVFAKEKVAMRSGETDLGLTVSNAPFISMVKTIAQNSNHHGILSLDTFLVNDEVYLLEMNCRISGHYPISHMAGANYPKMLVNWLQKKEAPSECFAFTEGLYIAKDLVPTILK